MVISLRTVTVLQVKAFVAVAAAKNFSEAAKNLGQTQPALSRRITDLEATLQEALFVRSKQGVELSEAGRALLTHATRVLACYEGMFLFMANYRKDLVIAGTESVMSNVPPTLVQRLEAEFGAVRVRFESGSSDEIQRKVREGRACVGVCAAITEHPELRYTPLLDAPLGFIFNPAFGLPHQAHALSDLKDLPLIRFSDAAFIPTLLRHHGVEWEAYSQSGIVVDGVSQACGVVRAAPLATLVTGVGASGAQVRGLCFVPLPLLLPSVTICLVSRRDSPFDARLEILKTLVADSVLSAQWHPSVRLLRRISDQAASGQAAATGGCDSLSTPPRARTSLSQIESIGFTAVKAFICVAQCKNIAQAALQLHQTPSGLGKVIRQLEATLGEQLFTRSSHGVVLTDAGTSVFPHARRLLTCLDESLALLRARKRAASAVVPQNASVLVGSIRITLGTLLAAEMLSDWLAEYCATHPGIAVHLVITDEYPDLVREGIDLALRPGPLPDSGYIAELLAPARRLACASPQYLQRKGVPVNPRALVDHDCLVHRSRGRWQDEWEFSPVDQSGVQPLFVKVGSALNCNDASTAYQWALQGRGITYSSELALRPALADGRLAQLFPGYVGAPAPLYAVLPGDRGTVPSHVRALVDALAVEFSSNNVVW